VRESNPVIARFRIFDKQPAEMILIGFRAFSFEHAVEEVVPSGGWEVLHAVSPPEEERVMQ
jgi:hypothetical protein